MNASVEELEKQLKEAKRVDTERLLALFPFQKKDCVEYAEIRSNSNGGRNSLKKWRVQAIWVSFPQLVIELVGGYLNDKCYIQVKNADELEQHQIREIEAPVVDLQEIHRTQEKLDSITTDLEKVIRELRKDCIHFFQETGVRDIVDRDGDVCEEKLYTCEFCELEIAK